MMAAIPKEWHLYFSTLLKYDSNAMEYLSSTVSYGEFGDMYECQNKS